MEAIEVLECVLCLLESGQKGYTSFSKASITHIEDIVVYDVCCPSRLGAIAYPDLPDPSIPSKELVNCETRPNQLDFQKLDVARRTIFSFGLEVEILAVEYPVSAC